LNTRLVTTKATTTPSAMTTNPPMVGVRGIGCAPWLRIAVLGFILEIDVGERLTVMVPHNRAGGTAPQLTRAAGSGARAMVLLALLFGEFLIEFL
jgi:hypothetical protein